MIPRDMLYLLSSFAEQCKRGWEIGEAIKLEGCDECIPNNTVIAGMGGSGIGGALVKAVVGSQFPCPIIVHRGYTLPAFVTSQTLFIAVSILVTRRKPSCPLNRRLHRGRNILAVTSGGKLKAFAGSTQSSLCDNSSRTTA